MGDLTSALRWYFVIQVFGLAALPLSLRLFRRLPDRGYGFAKPLGLLLCGWLFWLAGTFGWLENTSGAILATVVLVGGAGLLLLPRTRGLLDQSAPAQASASSRITRSLWPSILATEILFALSFAVWCLVRARMPRIQTAGGEKWMEIAFLRAILRARTFPPHDPWLSGFAISYYYFGYVIVAMLTRLSGVAPSVAFNLGIAALFALTCTGSYCLVHNLLAMGERGDNAPAADRASSSDDPARLRLGALVGGLVGPVLLTAMGNLEGLLESLHARGLGPARFWEWLDIRSINIAPPAWSEGSWVPGRFFWWWQASRVLRDYTPTGEHQEVIDEFPGFSFILGDMHPHVLALPFILLVIGLALNLYLRTSAARAAAHPNGLHAQALVSAVWPLSAWEFLVYALCLGALGFLNTWDFPIYLVLTVAAYAIGRLFEFPTVRRGARHVTVWQGAALLGALFASGLLLYLPFWIGFQSQAGGILLNLFNPTRLPQFAVMFGPLALIGSLHVADRAQVSRVRGWRVVKWSILAMLLISAALVLLVGGVLALASFGILPEQGAAAYVLAWLRDQPIPGLEGVQGARNLVSQSFLRRLLNSWTAVGLVGFVAAITLVLALRIGSSATTSDVAPPGDRRLVAWSRVDPFVLLLLGMGGLLALSVEYVYLRDHFGTRMNTVFKFYFQTWVLWAIAGAYALVCFVRHARVIAALASVLLVTCGLIYPVLAIPARAREYGGPPTLDGAAHLANTHPGDYLAIGWINEHISGAPVVLEAPSERFAAYVYPGRVSAHSGLPTVLGWAGHEHQWRGNYAEQGRREGDIKTIYSSEDVEPALTLLDQYDISYVYIGPIERRRYPPAGLAKFAQMMDAVYDAADVTIYQR